MSQLGQAQSTSEAQAPIHRDRRRFLRNAFATIAAAKLGMIASANAPGQRFYEGPSDVHVIGRNASQTKPAKFVVFLVKDKGAPALVPAK